MDFGLVGVDGLGILGQNQNGFPSSSEKLPKFSNGSGLMKQERSDPFFDENSRGSKMVKTVEDLGLRSDNNNNNAFLPKQQMLSFSSTNNNNNNSNNNNHKPQVSFLCAKDVGLIADKNAQNLVFSYFQQPSTTTTTYNRGIRGPFTPAQWIELEHQAMIYKYLTANVPVPANLLIPIRKALSSSGFPGFSIGSYPAHSYGWGAFHLGYTGSTDPEPGRCRRTDGKKWRCSRDAVPDQKYCERHINRGRHRSRKPVEGLSGQSSSGPTNSKVVVPPVSTTPTTNPVSMPLHHQLKGFQSTPTPTNRDSLVNHFHDEQGLSGMPTSMNFKTNDTQFAAPKQHISLDESSQSEFGVVSTDSLLNPTEKTTYLGCKSYNNSVLEFNPQQTQDQFSLRHFMDVWPKDNITRSPVSWPEDLKSDWTQLSMSIPMSTSDFLSSSSPNQEKVNVSSLKLTRELDPSSQTGLGVRPVLGESGMKQNGWIPIMWENSMGGPLGEVLNNTQSNLNSTLNFKGDGCDGSPQLGSSPTGVLQKTTVVSLSNSSSGGSPRGENNKVTLDGASLCDDMVGSGTQASSTFIPSM